MFPHEDKEFSQLLRIVAEQRGLSPGLVEKDYWVTHCLWALRQDSDLEVWFKGGTSLSKGFNLIERFSEDLDLRIDSTAAGAKKIAWPKRPTKTQEAAQVAYFKALGDRLQVEGTTISTIGIDPDGRGGDYKVIYPGHFLKEVTEPNSPFVKLEVGRARVAPAESRNITSFVHEFLAGREQLKDYTDNRAVGVRCVHPRVTLIEKLDAIAWRFQKEREPSEFIRHYEDAARIIRAENSLPPLEQTLGQTVEEMAPSLRLKRLVPSDHPAFAETVPKLPKLKTAYDAIKPMFWGNRIPLDEACGLIREWCKRLDG